MYDDLHPTVVKAPDLTCLEKNTIIMPVDE
jgi:hypothetical protein